MKKFICTSLLFFLCFTLTGCSLIESALNKVPFFEDADLDALTDKAEKAWDEVGKDALNDAADSAKDAILGSNELLWPQNDITEGVPQLSSGTISKVIEKDTYCEITIKDISTDSYNKYLSKLNESFGAPHSGGIYKSENKLIHAQHNSEKTTVVITISVIKPTVSNTYSSEETECGSSSEEDAQPEETLSEDNSDTDFSSEKAE